MFHRRLSLGFNRFLDRMGYVLFPISCPCCGLLVSRPLDWPVCNECRSRIETIVAPVCPQCGRPVQDNGFCDFCIEERTPPPHFPLRSAARYTGPVRDVILSAKLRGREDLADFLGGPLVDLAGTTVRDASRVAVAPVPLYQKRLIERGFNLPDRMAKRLAVEIGAVYRPGMLRRIIDTTPQKNLGWAERLQNVEGAFVCPDPGKAKGFFVFLVDDVVTSGATMAAAATPLLVAGADVFGLTLARA